MGRKIENFDDWYSGIAHGKRAAFEKYTKYVFRNMLNQQLECLRNIHDRDLIELLFDSMMEVSELPVSEMDRLIARIQQCYERQIQLDKTYYEGK
ncbi:hypothetical protein SAMN05192533_12010 [Mesobacillus persicus]|uniref:Uncharacterized protein n=1 Tax=Mesobacillus persicus TaxID=930146 RepID=A0A1H8J6G2_9BACI|nr:hypothetical protein [Mesobacillus persicus]SEN76420.1 hypothetical protein SAMN05192533_12010 [Mesobacillus persicus]